jgi:hypothetical protein
LAPHARASEAGRDRRIDAPAVDADRFATTGGIEPAAIPLIGAAVPRAVEVQAVPGADQRDIGPQALIVGAAGIAGTRAGMMS